VGPNAGKTSMFVQYADCCRLKQPADSGAHRTGESPH
jgi:hypothetical protein